MNNPTYEEALAFIHGAYGKGEKRGLLNMQALLSRMGQPQMRYPAVHVAGTNGKGSICAFVQAVLHHAGYRTGLYTSPFLQRFNERIRIDGQSIADGTLARLTGEVMPHVMALRSEGVHPTEFEIGTALAFLAFARAEVDIAVIEVGLGGRLDPTNVIVPRVCAIGTIGLDHTRVLGDTLEAIALEKAHIAKPHVPLFLSAQNPASVQAVVSARCQAAGAPYALADTADGFVLGIPGAHQAYNAGVALSVLDTLRNQGFDHITSASVLEGFAHARWPGRLEWIASESPPILLDGAHNEQGVQSLAAYLHTQPPAQTTVICGIMQDKDWQPMVRAFASFADAVIAVTPDSHRALPPSVLADAFVQHGVPAWTADSIPDAMEMAREVAGIHGRIVVAGSLYLVGAYRTYLLGTDDVLPAPT